VVTGGVDVSTALLATKWDFIYFTGSPRVGQIVAKAAAEHMTPTALELGGKAPCLIHQSAPLRESARRIINTKAINAGQTCMAPDYLLVHEAHHADFLAALQAEMKEQFGDEPIRSKDFGRMCTTSHYDRMVELLAKAGGKQIRIGAAGPDRATKYMPLTLVDGPTVGSPILKEEIFGPLLPVLTYTSLAEAVKLIQSIDPTPLALYVFSVDETVAETLLSEVQSGTVVVNDCYLHHICHTLPFGGVGTSGYGVCHGRYSFETFTYQRAVLWRNATLDIDMTIPLPVRHCSAADKWMLRPKLLSLLRPVRLDPSQATLGARARGDRLALPAPQVLGDPVRDAGRCTTLMTTLGVVSRALYSSTGSRPVTLPSGGRSPKNATQNGPNVPARSVKVQPH
jgi:aldehyde dehydrogenase (NAD+)